MKKPSAISRIASKFSDPRNVSKAVEAQKIRARAQADYEAPANPTENTLSSIWSKLLAIDKVGRNDNFFHMGGHSLLATQMLARLRDACDVELPLKTVFESPVLARFAERIESSRKSGVAVARPTPQPRGATAPLSFAQQRLWFLDQLDPGIPFYNVPQRYQLHGNLNLQALQAAIDAVVNRQESLRTTFAQSDSGPVQVIAPKLKIPLRHLDLTHLVETAREAEARRLAQEEAATPFDLAAGPLLRVLVIKLRSDEHEMVLNTHHIVYDRWSHGILLEELAAHYRAAWEGIGDPMPPLPLQYADYAIWQRHYLEGDVFHRQVAYWKERLAGAPSIVGFPTDRPRTATAQHRGSIEEFVLPGNLVSYLRELCWEEGATLFMGMLAAFKVLLSRYSGLSDIVVGSPIANRNLTEIEPLIGFFVGTLALRTDLSGAPTFRELLRRVRETCLGAFAHEAVPFERLVEELRPERNLSHNPIFQVVFALQTAPVQVVELPDLRMERRTIHTQTALFDMAWFAFEMPDGVLLRLEYNTDLFDRSTIVRALEHFQNLLEGIVADPGQRISALPLLGTEEKQRLFVDWNNTAVDYPRDRCVHELFERQAALWPDNPAVVAGSFRLTYGQLNQRANQLAHRLRRTGVGPESLVAIALERSPDLIVSVLAVLKSGGAYLALDPAYPADRLAFMVLDAQVAVLLTNAESDANLPPHPAVIHLDTDWPAIAQEPAENPVSLANAENLAYVIYTSGSTGKPKGVEIEHRGLLNLSLWHQREYGVQPHDRATQIASPAFDASVWEIWPYLASGAALHIPDEETRSSPAELLRWLEREKISLTFLPTPLAEAVLAEWSGTGWSGSHLRGLLTGGDKLHQYPDAALPFPLFNHYGPTENSVVTTWTRVTPGGNGPPPIGKPIANAKVYVLNEDMNPVPVGIAGELFIGGDGLARGYRNRPELTAANFLKNPFSLQPGARLYRSGDRVRYLPDGNLEFLGRLDHQLKIRGFRIEPGEIEAILGQHPWVAECVADVREDANGERRLAAYVVLNPEEARSGRNDLAPLRAWLHEKVPDYMVPSAFVPLDSLPLTSNGKIDRLALPSPAFELVESSSSYVAPRTLLEEELAAIWSDVLNLRRIGVNHDFFALGGHSLLAAQIVSRVRQRLDVQLPLKFLFEAPTIGKLAARIENARARDTAELTPISRVSRDQPIPASFAQQRLWFLDQLDPHNPLYNAPWTVRMRGQLRLDALEFTVQEIVRRHEVFRTTFQAVDGIPHMTIAPDFDLQIPVIDLSAIPGEEQERAVRDRVAEDARLPFNLKTGPVFRASLLRLNSQDHVLLLSSHHIANDGWSLWRFVEEMGELYEAFCEGRPSPLPELPVQYADYAVWQRNWMTGEVLDKQLSYWKKQLAGAPGTLELPADRPRPAVLSYRGAKERAFLPHSLAGKLHELSRSEGATLYMTLLTAFQTLLFRYTGEEDVVVGSPVANRTRSDIEGLIGFFVNTIVMRTDLSGNPTFRSALRRVRASALDALSNQDLPFERLVEALHPDRYLGRVPLFQIWFALQNLPRTVLEMPGLELSSMDVHNGTSKFDLGLFVVEKPDGLHCAVEYSTDLFHADTIQRLLGHFRVLLESIVENPDQPIAELPLLTAPEQYRLLVEWNDPSQEFPRDICIHNLFERQVTRTPDNVAVIFEDKRLTYAELNRRSNQLAHRLRAFGVDREVLVAICLERSLEMLVGILGILKAGGGYLPLDPAYPRDRLAFMLADSQVSLIITQSDLLSSLPPHPATVISMDADWPSISREPVEDPVSRTRPENVAYVIYTSGSTGKPKGCVVTHANTARLFTATDHWYGFGPGDIWTLFHSIAFDFSVWEIWGALLYGGKLVVVPRIIARSPEQFHELLIRHRVTVLNQTPSAFRHLILADRHSEHSDRLALRYVIFGGEALEFKTLLPWIERHGEQPALINMYGITETTVHVTYFKVTGTAIGKDTVSLIGRPIPDLQVYVLDAGRRPVPVGVIGEMYVGGYGVARGYLNRPDLTAERFITDPFHPDAAGRLYKTGDLARFLPDGNLQYMGRIDHQVKIRGFRIELGEIETLLDSHPGVRQSVVMARAVTGGEDEPGDQHLIAYVVSDPGYNSPDRPGAEDALSSEQVSQWAATFDEAYRQGANSDATFNIAGWNSSYTGEPIPAEEMRVWVDCTVDRILALRPRRLLEIGCGTGLLTFRVAPHCEHYHGTDVSQTALGFLEQQLKRPELRCSHITLERKPAHEFDCHSAHHAFDTVVMNSVIQYFPSLDYFLEVLKGAVEAVGPQGAVFIGDVRSFPLLETLHSSVQMFQAGDSASRSYTWQRVQKNLAQESELLIAPEFFHALRHQLPQISHVEIHLKRGRAHNELTAYRYDVVLRVGNSARPDEHCPWLDWRKHEFSLALLRETLQTTRPDLLGLKGVPNARLQYAVAARKLMMSEDGPDTIGEVRRLLNLSPPAGSAVEPDDFWELEQEFPYRVEIRPSSTEIDGCCDVLLQRRREAGETRYGVVRFPGEADTFLPLRAYANNPLRQKIAGRLIPQLRAWVSAQLPEYMMPSAFVLMDSMPLSANGKINRRALPGPDRSRLENPGSYVPPRTPAEEIVAAILADVLRLHGVGVEDNFFHLGGHSLSATQAVARINRAFQVELSVRVLFETPTAAALAASIERLQRDRNGLSAPPLVRVPRGGSLPLSFAQQRLWFIDQLEPDNPLYSIPRATRMRGVLNVGAMERALHIIVERHEVLRTIYSLHGDNPVQVILDELKIPLVVTDLSTSPPATREREAHRILEEESQKPFQLARGPIIRALLLKLDPEDHIFFFNIHHIANDGWSMRLFMQELATLYQAFVDDQPASLPDLPVQYADYAVWQRSSLHGEVLEKHVAYWRTQLEGAPPVLSLPTDSQPPATPSFRGDIQKIVLPVRLAEEVRSLSRQHGTTAFMTMLAAFQCLLSYRTGQCDIVVGTDVAGRTNVQTEALIGFFVNLLVLRTNLSGDPSFQELLGRVRETALGAYAHQDLPFDKLVAELQPERTLSNNPLVQILFVQQDILGSTLTMPGIEFTPFKLTVSSKFDLAVFVGETGKGTVCNWVYKSDLFDVKSIAGMAELFQAILEKTAANPKTRLHALMQELAEMEDRQRLAEHERFQEVGLQKLKTIRRKAVTEKV